MTRKDVLYDTDLPQKAEIEKSIDQLTLRDEPLHFWASAFFWENIIDLFGYPEMCNNNRSSSH